ncbi:MAG: flagellar hook-associated protein FlgK [Thermodesulfobacteriota bacterium]|nr:flagellar hook-associated protein FlgK [Thermodesulfobacteriota bacterium]
MGGLNAVLDIAKSALFAQQTGIQVTGHNIANVDTENYSRQQAPHSARNPVKYAGMMMGNGVEVQEIIRTCDAMLERRVTTETSSLARFEQSSEYMGVVESVFNEDAENSISTLMSDFWNAWSDLANMPDGSAERVVVHEKASLMAERLNNLRADLNDVETELERRISAEIPEVNSIAEEIARLNESIVAVETRQNANDLRDQRNGLIRQLSKSINVDTFEQPNGSITVNTANGKPLVNGVDSYSLDWSGGMLLYTTPNGGSIDITDNVSDGSISGWLDMRDEYLAKYKADLDVMAKSLVWSVNKQQSAGAGLQFFSSGQTGTYATDDSGQLSTLTFGDRIDYSKDFKLWIKDTAGASARYSEVNIDMGLSGASADTWAGNAVGATNYKYVFTVTESGSVSGDILVTEADGVGLGTDQTGADYSSALDGAIAGQTITVSDGASTYTVDIADSGGDATRSAASIAEALSRLEGVTAYASDTRTDIGGISRAALTGSEGDAIDFTLHAGGRSQGISFQVGADDAATQDNYEAALHSAIDTINGQNDNEDLALTGSGDTLTITSDSGTTLGIEYFSYTDNTAVAVGNFGGSQADDTVSFELADDATGTNGITVSFAKGNTTAEDAQNLYSALTTGDNAETLTTAGYTFRLDTVNDRVVIHRDGGNDFAVDNLRDDNTGLAATADVHIQEAGATTLDGGSGSPVSLTEGGDDDSLAAATAGAARSVTFNTATVTEGGGSDSAVVSGTMTIFMDPAYTISSDTAGNVAGAGGLFDTGAGVNATTGESIITLGGEDGFSNFDVGDTVSFDVDGTTVSYTVAAGDDTPAEYAAGLETALNAAGLGGAYTVMRNNASVSILRTDGSAVNITNFADDDGSGSGNAATLTVGTGTGLGITRPDNQLLDAGAGGTTSATSLFYGSDGTIEWEKFAVDGSPTGAGGTIDVSGEGPFTVEGGLTVDFASGSLVAGNTFTVNTDGAGAVDPLSVSVSGAANSVLDTYTFDVVSGGNIGSDVIELEWTNSITSGTVTIDANGEIEIPRDGTIDGMTMGFSAGTLFEGDTFTMTTDKDGAATVNYPSDWHWTLSSFKDQFNRQAAGIEAGITEDNKLSLSETGQGLRLTNMRYVDTEPPAGAAAGIDRNNVTIKVDNYDAFSATASGFRVERSNDEWSVPPGVYPGVDVDVSALDDMDMDNGFSVTLDGVKAFTVQFDEPVANDGYVEFDVANVAGGDYSYAFSDDGAEDSGLSAALGLNTFFTGGDANTIAVNELMDNKSYIAAAQVDGDSGEIAAGDNRNALAMAALQQAREENAEWTFTRGADASSRSLKTSVESYHQSLIGSIGINAKSISREASYRETMVTEITKQRDSVSAVSLDEEMVNLMKFQHAYSVAAKLFTTTDEMMETLINTR